MQTFHQNSFFQLISLMYRIFDLTTSYGKCIQDAEIPSVTLRESVDVVLHVLPCHIQSEINTFKDRYLLFVFEFCDCFASPFACFRNCILYRYSTVHTFGNKDDLRQTYRQTDRCDSKPTCDCVCVWAHGILSPAFLSASISAQVACPEPVIAHDDKCAQGTLQIASF